MVPFSFKPELSYSRVMKKTFFDHRSVEAGSLAFEMGFPFLLSCLPYFNPGPGFLSLLCATVSLWPIRLRVWGRPGFKAVLKGFKVI
jgi:hypothetical protein